MFSFTKSARVDILLDVSLIVNILSHRCLVYTYSLTCKHFSPPNLLWLYQVIYHRVTVLNYDVDTLYWDYFSFTPRCLHKSTLNVKIVKSDISGPWLIWLFLLSYIIKYFTVSQNLTMKAIRSSKQNISEVFMEYDLHPN